MRTKLICKIRLNLMGENLWLRVFSVKTRCVRASPILIALKNLISKYMCICNGDSSLCLNKPHVLSMAEEAPWICGEFNHRANGQDHSFNITIN